MTRTGPSDGLTATGDDVASIRTALLAHYDRSRRELPWRGETDPYRIWVSEIMLQQTRVETVIPYYRRWLEQFPDLETLADAETDDVLLEWEGLGYYRRARNLQAGAVLVRERHGGEVPDTVSELRALPGVGEYTAGAIASIAFNEPVPAVDGNVKRVLARILDEPEPTGSALRKLAAGLVDPERPGDWNQALMDLGATVCSPRRPLCDRCPLSPWCRARVAGTQEERPAPKSRGRVPESVRVTAVVVDHRGHALVERQPREGLLGGLWAFPSADADEGMEPIDTARGAARAAGSELSQESVSVLLPAVRHRFSHLQVTYVPVLLRGRADTTEDRRWVPLSVPRDVALPVAQQKIAQAALTALNT